MTEILPLDLGNGFWRCSGRREERILDMLHTQGSAQLDAKSVARIGHPLPEDTSSAEADADLAAFRTALDQQAIVAATDRAGVITAVNDLFCEISQYSRSELVGQSHNILNSRHHPSSFFKGMWRQIGSGTLWHGDICNRAKDGSLYWVDTTIVPKRGADGRITGYVSVRYDITARKAAEAALVRENQRRLDAQLLLHDIIEAVPNGISACDANGRLVLFNSAFKDCYPLAKQAIFENALFEDVLRMATEKGQFVLPLDTDAAKAAFIASRLSEFQTPGRQFVQHLSDGRWLQVQERLSQSGHIVGVRTDVSELKQAERQIKHQAERDALTGLYNRRVILERLARVLNSSRSSEKLGALIIVDLDGFKAINDNYGHDAGDELLVALAARLKSTVRQSDVVARLGGDEFALIIQNLNAERDVVRIAEKLLRSLGQQVKLGRRLIIPSASLGVAVYPRDGSTPKELLKNADLALYQAKDSGRSTYVICTQELREGKIRRASMIKALRTAMARGQIEMALQPQVKAGTAEHVGFEALVRWKTRHLTVPPTELISLAEEAGLMVQLGYYIIDKSFKTIKELMDLGLNPGRVAINAAADQLRQPDFSQRLRALIELHEMRPQDVEVEVTENVILERASDRIATTLQELRDIGVSIALDDFGTGYASLSHLKRFPIDRLKIDRSFVRDMTSDNDDSVIARTVISLAHSLGMSVVAEGVETEEQFRFLSNYGCDFIQGYLIGKPMFADAARTYLTEISNRGRLWPPVATSAIVAAESAF
ncbi:MAG: EAL domain-containing protein [Devosia sp.]